LIRCAACGYDLAGRVAGERCPECGQAIPRVVLRGGLAAGVLVSWQADVRPGAVMAIGVRPLLALAAAIALLCSACLGTHFTLRRRFGGTG